MSGWCPMKRSLRLPRILRWVLVSLGVPAGTWAEPSGGVRLEAPLDYQVHQRVRRASGTIRVAGTLGTGLDAGVVETRLRGAPGGGDWQLLTPLTAGQRTFHGSLEAPAGGWYGLEVRVRRDGEASAVAVARVEHVAVGEVFLVAGQSNAANHGEERLQPRTGLVATYDGRTWRPAWDPQPGASGNGGSFLPPLGDLLVEHFGVPVGWIALAAGGTSVREWLPVDRRFLNPPTVKARVRQRADGLWESDGALYQVLAGRLRTAGPLGIRAVLWHQGESDANQADPSCTLAGADYLEHLRKLIVESRNDAGWRVPWFVARASYHSPDDPGSEDIRAAQRVICDDGLAIAGPDTDALTGAFRDSGGQGVHFSAAGLREHALLWSRELAPWLERQLAEGSDQVDLDDAGHRGGRAQLREPERSQP